MRGPSPRDKAALPCPQHPATGPRLSVLPYASDALPRNGNKILQSAKGEASEDHNLERTTLVAPSLNTQSTQYQSQRSFPIHAATLGSREALAKF